MDSARRGDHGSGASSLRRVGARLLCRRLESGSRPTRRHPDRAARNGGIRHLRELSRGSAASCSPHVSQPLVRSPGRGFELDVVTAVVIGGVNVFGGSGSVPRAVLGAVYVATIQNGFTLMRISELWKIFFNGAAIVIAVTIRRADHAATSGHAAAAPLGRDPRGTKRRSKRECSWSRRSGRLVARWEVMLDRADHRRRHLELVTVKLLPQATEPARPRHAVRVHRAACVRPHLRRDRWRDRHLRRFDNGRLGRVLCWRSSALA